MAANSRQFDGRCDKQLTILVSTAWLTTVAATSVLPTRQHSPSCPPPKNQPWVTMHFPMRLYRCVIVSIHSDGIFIDHLALRAEYISICQPMTPHWSTLPAKHHRPTGFLCGWCPSVWNSLSDYLCDLTYAQYKFTPTLTPTLMDIFLVLIKLQRPPCRL